MLEESKCSKNRPALANKYHRTSQGMPPLNTQSWPPSLVSAAESCSKRYAAKNTEATTCRRLQHFVGVPSTNPWIFLGMSWKLTKYTLEMGFRRIAHPLLPALLCFRTTSSPHISGPRNETLRSLHLFERDAQLLSQQVSLSGGAPVAMCCVARPKHPQLQGSTTGRPAWIVRIAIDCNKYTKEQSLPV
jgi:hypothetical protein